MKKHVSLLLIIACSLVAMKFMLSYSPPSSVRTSFDISDAQDDITCRSSWQGLPFPHTRQYIGGPSCGLPIDAGKPKFIPLLADIAIVMMPALAYGLLYFSSNSHKKTKE
ncbi:hypothetical protein KBB17_03355 [Candidatus Saccharibacteria bacterium]|jgi:hypothetical protein|nr:hypothetical protein [Candidatus Saccharibacteria bacterium]MBP9131851.1 hypothetical protein [Candidatus Saccharibacteria bacterium]